MTLVISASFIVSKEKWALLEHNPSNLFYILNWACTESPCKTACFSPPVVKELGEVNLTFYSHFLFKDCGGFSRWLARTENRNRQLYGEVFVWDPLLSVFHELQRPSVAAYTRTRVFPVQLSLLLVLVLQYSWHWLLYCFQFSAIHHLLKTLNFKPDTVLR